jgi:hypothetical protein
MMLLRLELALPRVSPSLYRSLKVRETSRQSGAFGISPSWQVLRDHWRICHLHGGKIRLITGSVDYTFGVPATSKI